ncbi:methyltransferase domain-containing protein [Colletotrichum truncatum]|uniref:Methyltransferase domain-containing protein n=1 Tax=Colletotrichum truncatum TaxID=5467 RepID=A0ACC3YXX6_COLTU|nr:methyltransferase domain-containing protein [Colletotrichum truncatum]KAF6790888.1 methyltransferase domain-containing protein [Colletotrichum truncatum]
MQAVDNNIVIGDKNKAAPWYMPTLEGEISTESRELLENYAHIAPEDVKEHVLTMRDKIWDVFPYPCVGHFSFLDLNLKQRPIYPRMVARLQEPDGRHLEVACCIGQDLRKLVYDGVPSQNITAVELEQGYIDAGYELFRDKDTLKTRFVIADMLAEDNQTLNAMEGQFDTAHLGQCLHLWDRNDQMVVLKRVIRMLKQKPGVIIVGHLVGHADGIELPANFNKPSLRHNLQTWESMWSDISKETNTQWKLRTVIGDDIGHHRNAGAKKPAWWDKNWRFVAFEVEREA